VIERPIEERDGTVGGRSCTGGNRREETNRAPIGRGEEKNSRKKEESAEAAKNHKKRPLGESGGGQEHCEKKRGETPKKVRQKDS